MTDPVIQNALARRNEMMAKIEDARLEVEKLRSLIDAWDAEVVRVDRFIKDWEDFAGEKVDGATLDTPTHKELSPTSEAEEISGGTTGDVGDARNKVSLSHKRPKNPPKEQVAAAVYRIISAHGRPMMRDVLYDKLCDLGFVIEGKEPTAVLQTMLWRQQDVVVNLKGYGYWLADQPWDAASYVPNSSSESNLEVVDSRVNSVQMPKPTENLFE